MNGVRSLVGAASVTLDEDEVMARAATLDPRNFEAIYERHATMVFRYLRSRTTSDDEASELASQTFERALRAIAQFKPSGGGMAAWLLRIARNAHVDAHRRGITRVPDPTKPGREITQPLASLEDGVVLRALVGALPPTQRDAIQLRFAAGLTAKEIGTVLGLSESAAQKQVERALQALREAIHAD